MKSNPITWITGGVLVVIFALMLFTFQVRQTEVAVVTTFSKFSHSIPDPGFQTRLPWPIQKVYTFDKRIQVFENKFEQTLTADQISILITVYVGWRVADPQVFLVSQDGDTIKAEKNMENTVRSVTYERLAQHNFSELVSTNRSELKFDQIEREIQAGISNTIRSSYGIDVQFVGIKQLGLPESISGKVFERMKAERLERIKSIQAEGEKEAQRIRSDADRDANVVLTSAKAQAIEISSAAEAKASEYYRVMQQNPELAKFLFQRKALEQSLSNRTTLILDQQTPPFNLMRQGSSMGTNSAAGSK